jgi:hypothetical protein
MLTEEYRKALTVKRVRSLALAWAAVDPPHKEVFVFNPSIVVKAIRHYVEDLNILKKRYGIPNRVQAPRIAGLMANAILKYRPLVPMEGTQKGIDNNMVNEYLAIYHGISICANFETDGKQAMAGLINKPFFDEWLKRFVFLLHERNYTTEALIVIFETLCLAAFPEAIESKTLHI